MGLHQRLRPFRVVRLERGKHRHVLGARFVNPARQLQALVARQAQHLAQVADHAGQPAVAGQALERLVNLVVGFVIGVDVAGLGVAREVGVQALQRVEIVLGDVARGLVGTAAFEQRHQRKDLIEILLGQCVDEAAAPGLQPHQPFGREHLERLTQRRARGAERGGQRHFVNPCAGHQRVIVDHRPQTVCHFEVQRLPDDSHDASGPGCREDCSRGVCAAIIHNYGERRQRGKRFRCCIAESGRRRGAQASPGVFAEKIAGIRGAQRGAADDLPRPPCRGNRPRLKEPPSDISSLAGIHADVRGPELLPGAGPRLPPLKRPVGTRTFPLLFCCVACHPVDVLPRSIAAGSFAMPPVFL
ncbi:hypothetical protein D3C87_1237910 [compost metagenome]